APSAMAKSARARSTCAAGALSERLRRVSSWRSSAVSGRRGSFRWRDMGHLGARGSPHYYTSSHGRRPTSGYLVEGSGFEDCKGLMRCGSCRLDLLQSQSGKGRVGIPKHRNELWAGNKVLQEL